MLHNENGGRLIDKYNKATNKRYRGLGEIRLDLLVTKIQYKCVLVIPPLSVAQPSARNLLANQDLTSTIVKQWQQTSRQV